MLPNTDPLCNIAGQCEAHASPDDQIASCRHCGKELIKRDGQWWTWDADLVPHPQPQRGP